MEDLQIISLYFKRDEAAISETATKYGAFCHGVALNILSISADADECVNDTYLQAWNSIPPQKPDTDFSSALSSDGFCRNLHPVR